jgi:formylglycine-generating enzyme required for sulfatase activity
VTQAQWFAVMTSRPWRGRPDVLDNASAPAVYVSWEDARRFVQRLNAATDGGFSLLTEAQWEYACRAGAAGSSSAANGPDGLETHAWYYANTRPVGEGYAHPVATREPNAWGLYDMHGNAAEWVVDWYHAETWRRASRTDPRGPANGDLRVVRGGSWESLARQCRCFDRAAFSPATERATIGFRVCRNP